MAARKHRTRSTYSGRSHHELSAQNKPITIEIPNRTEGLIVSLPDELLYMIISLATSKEVPEKCQQSYCEPQHDRGTVEALSLTCRQLSRFVLPFLYKSISFVFPPSTNSLKRLRHAVKQPSLLHFCQRLSIGFRDFVSSKRRISVVNKLLSSVRNVRCLELRQEFWHPDKTMREGFVRDLTRNMHGVEHLVIDGVDWELTLPRIINNIDLPQLRCFDLYRLSPGYITKHNRHMVVPLDPKKHRTASCTSLSLLSCLSGTPQVLEKLIQFPRALTDIRLPAASWSSNVFTSIPLIHSLLLTHKDTLKSLTIGTLSSPAGGDLFDASAFPNLKVLVLSGTLKGINFGTPAADANSLLAPNLKTLEWSFRGDGYRSEVWTDFGDSEQRWISGLAKEAIRRKSTLREIKIKFDPDPRLSKLKEGYPWDRMDKIRNEIRPHGIELVYSKPAVTKERWLDRGSLWCGVWRPCGDAGVLLDREGNILDKRVYIPVPWGSEKDFGSFWDTE